MSALSEFALRPEAPATKGRSIYLKTNIFPLIEIEEKQIYQYDVVVVPEIPVEDTKLAWMKFESQVKKKYGAGTFLAFDGKKNAYSSSSIQGMTIKVQVDRNQSLIPEYPALPPPAPGRGGGRGGFGNRGGRGRGGYGGRGGYDNRPPPPQYVTKALSPPLQSRLDPDLREIEITIKPTTSVSLEALRKFICGRGPENSECTHCITSITAFARHIPSFKFVSVGANLYSPDDRVAIGGGLEIWRGFHQSIRALKAGHLGVNVDIAATVFRRGNAKLLDLILETLKVETPNDLLKIRDLPAKISASFKGSNLVMTHIPGKKIRFKASGFSRDNADQFTFDGPNGKVNVTSYFKSTYGITLNYPNLPLILKGSKSAIPIEVVTMSPSQRFLKKLDPDRTSDVIRNTVMRPNKRGDVINKAVLTSLALNKNEYLNSIGYRIDPNPMTVKARIIDPPTVVFGDNRTANGRDGYWKMPGKVSRPMKLFSFAFVFFCNMRKDEAYSIADTLIRTCKAIGVAFPQLSNPPDYVILNRGDVRDIGDARSVLSFAADDASRMYSYKCQLIFCIIRKGARLSSPPTSLYEEIKRITLTEMDVLSQCMLFEKVMGDRLNNQYAENVAIKVNVKLGGATNRIDNIPFFDAPTMLFGADVTHAHAASIAPSVAAVVSSVDPHATRYYTYLRAQPSRQEIITDLGAMTSQALDAFKNYNKCYPKRIFFFRDGVSTGQFSQVMKGEVSALKKALASRGCEDTTITFVIVQKRHHVRLFPVDENQDRSGNSLPGTIIDDEITHPTEFNFYLQSHAGIQGTSRPTLYHVLLDENNVSLDSFQKLCYSLCFLSERATRSISMVSPAYRAHIAAFAGKMFLDSDVDFSDSSSAISKDAAHVSLRQVKRSMEQNTMYYM